MVKNVRKDWMSQCEASLRFEWSFWQAQPLQTACLPLLSLPNSQHASIVPSFSAPPSHSFHSLHSFVVPSSLSGLYHHFWFTLVCSLPSFLHFKREFGRLLSSLPACLQRLPPSYPGAIINSVNLPFLPTQPFIIIICSSFSSSSSHHYRKDCFIIKEKVSKVSRSSLTLTRLKIQEVTQERRVGGYKDSCCVPTTTNKPFFWHNLSNQRKNDKKIIKE